MSNLYTWSLYSIHNFLLIWDISHAMNTTVLPIVYGQASRMLPPLDVPNSTSTHKPFK